MDARAHEGDPGETDVSVLKDNFQGERLCFPREERLKKRDDIRMVFKKGRHVSCGGARLFYRANEKGLNRVAFTFARKFGNAVQRNRARRLGREAYRHLRGSIKSGIDMALLFYPEDIDFNGRYKQLKTLFSKAALFCAKP
jgi:ribonuclease P protein component